MGTNERLRASLSSYTYALRQLAHLIKTIVPDEWHSSLRIELAAQSHLNTILLRKICLQIAPDLITPNLFQQVELLNAPPREISDILHNAGTRLATFQWEGSEITLEDLALLVAVSPIQNSMGAYFTPHYLAVQICRETIANWIWLIIPEVLKGFFSSGIKELIAKQNYITGPDAEDFFIQLPICCQKGLEDSRFSRNLIETLNQQILGCRILDPACGSGIFLVETAKILLAISQQLNSILGISKPENNLAREICTKNLYGIDLAPEYVRVARILLLCTLLPHLQGEDVLPSFTNICQHIQHGNFLLSPFSEKLKTPVPPTLDSRILIEIATCFLDVSGTNPGIDMAGSRNLEKYARGPIDGIPLPAWLGIATCLGIPGNIIKKENLSSIVLEQLIPSLKLEQSYDIILGNPPQEGARKETGRQQFTSWTTRVQRLCIKYLKKSQVYSDLQGAWDFSLPFAIRAMEVLAPQGMLAFILPRSIGTQSFARKFLTRILPKIRRVAYFAFQAKAIFGAWDPNRQELLPAGNDFLALSCSNTQLDSPRFRVEELSPINYVEPSALNEFREGDEVLRFLAQPPHMPKLRGIPLKFFVTITKGATLCAKAEWRRTRGSFKIRDLISKVRDPNHPLRFVEPAHIAPFFIAGESFLEYHHVKYPDRVPANIHRWRDDAFFRGPILVTPLSKRVPSFALIPENFEPGVWRSPETIVLFKRWADWFQEFPKKLPPAIDRMQKDVFDALQQSITHGSPSDLDQRSKILSHFSEKMPLEVLALVLSSPPVHELRIRGGKSFGKFEAGDWENIPLPFFEDDEVKMLLDDYRKIFQIIAKEYERVSRSGNSLIKFTRTLEKALFKEIRQITKNEREEVVDSTIFKQIRGHLEHAFRLIEDSYNRKDGNLEKMNLISEK